MDKNIEKISSSMFISMHDMITIPKFKLKEIVNGQLAQGLAYYITNHMDELPAYHTVDTDPNTGQEEHRVRINIISDSELKRLKDIERHSLWEVGF